MGSLTINLYNLVHFLNLNQFNELFNIAQPLNLPNANIDYILKTKRLSKRLVLLEYSFRSTTNPKEYFNQKR